MPLQEFPPAQLITTPVIPGGTAGSVLFFGSGGAITQNNSSFFWDNANLFQTNTSTLGKQLRLAYDSTHYVDFTLTQGSGGFNQFFNITPKTAAFPNAFCGWHLQGSDFCFSYEGDEVNGNGVPNVTIRGPASSGYAASSGPGLNLYNNLSAVDNKLWSMYLNDNVLTFQTINDANNTTNNWLTVTRSGNTLTNAIMGTHWLSGSDNGLDLGGTSNRWKTIYYGTQIIGPQGSAGTPSFGFTGATNYGFYFASGIGPAVQYNGSLRVGFTSVGMSIFNGFNLGFSGGTGSADVFIGRDAANIISILNGNNAQTFRTYAGNGANLGIVTVNESLTIAAAPTTDSATTIPAGAVILSVAVRVTTVIPTAATFTVTAATGGNTFDTAAVSVAANSTDAGTAAGALYTSAGTKVRITPNVQPGAATGVVRLAICYYLSTPPNS